MKPLPRLITRTLAGAVCLTTFWLAAWFWQPPVEVAVVLHRHDGDVGFQCSWESADQPVPLTSNPLPAAVELAIVATGNRNRASTGTGIYIRPLFDTDGVMVAPLTDFEAEPGWQPWGNDERLFAEPVPGEPVAARWTGVESRTLALHFPAAPSLGIVEIHWNDEPIRNIDLYAPQEKWITVELPPRSDVATYCGLLSPCFGNLLLELDRGTAQLERASVSWRGVLLLRRSFDQAEMRAGDRLSLAALAWWRLPLLTLSRGPVWQRLLYWLAAMIALLLPALLDACLRRRRTGRRARLPDDTAERAQARFGQVVAGTTLLLCLLFVLTHINSLRSWDNYHYAKLAALMFRGVRLYSEVWHDKPPLAALVYAPVALLRTPWAMNVLCGGVFVLNGYLLTRYLHGAGFARVSAALGGWSYAWCALLLFEESDFLSLGHMSNLLLMPALVLTLPSGSRRMWRWLAVGAILAAMTCLRQNNVLFAGWLGVLALQQREARRLLWLGTGFAAGLMLIISATLPLVDWPLAPYVYFEYPRRYVALHGGPPLAQFLQLAVTFTVPVWPFVAAGAVRLLVTALVRRGSRAAPHVPVGVLGAAFLVTLAVILAPQRGFNHYGLYWLPWLGLAICWIVDPFLPGLLAGRARRAGTTVVLLAAVVVLGYHGLARHWRVALEGRNAHTLRRIVQTVRTETTPAETLYVFGGDCLGLHQNAIYLGAGRRPAHPVSNYVSLIPDTYAALPTELRDFWEKMEDHPPKLLVYAPHTEIRHYLPQELLVRIRNLFHSRYRAIANIDGFLIGVRK
ncbi:MAG: hypothetical protein KKB50_10010 [Planctomycetes bacterium]|nr:hypothetical protein [Planctomycetota bacterium]